MRKRLILLSLLSGILLLSSCGSARSSENVLNSDAAYTEALDTVAADFKTVLPEVKIEADLSFGENARNDFIDPAGLPADSLNLISPSKSIFFTLPEVVKGPLVTKNSNGVSEYLSSMSVSNSSIIVNQSTGRKLKTDTSKLNALVKNYPYDTSILAIRVSDGSYIAYNIDQKYSCASTIKAPYSMYVYSLAANKQISLNDTIKYQSYHYFGGSGVLKYNNIGTSYTIRDLVRYSMIDSDNIAHTMLYDRFGNGVDELFAASGSSLSMRSSEWPQISARDVAIWWNEILEFRDTGAIGKEFFDIALSVRSPILVEALGTRDQAFAHKSGWVRNVAHEAGIIMSDDPYILVVLTTKSYNSADTYTSHIVNVIREVDKIMKNK